MRAMTLMGRAGDMTVEKCNGMARDKGYKYAAVQYSEECWAANDISKYTVTGICDKRCLGNNAQICGGRWPVQR